MSKGTLFLCRDRKLIQVRNIAEAVPPSSVFSCSSTASTLNDGFSRMSACDSRKALAWGLSDVVMLVTSLHEQSRLDSRSADRART